MKNSFRNLSLSLVALCSLPALSKGAQAPTKSGLSYSASYSNFDGSTTFNEPRLEYKGQPTKIQYISAWHTSRGLCSAMGYKPYAHAAESAILMNSAADEALLVFAYTGQLSEVRKAGPYPSRYVRAITCR